MKNSNIRILALLIAPALVALTAAPAQPSGPSLITVIAGSLTVYEANDPTCMPVTYTAGQSSKETNT